MWSHALFSYSCLPFLIYCQLKHALWLNQLLYRSAKKTITHQRKSGWLQTTVVVWSVTLCIMGFTLLWCMHVQNNITLQITIILNKKMRLTAAIENVSNIWNSHINKPYILHIDFKVTKWKWRIWHWKKYVHATDNVTVMSLMCCWHSTDPVYSHISTQRTEYPLRFELIENTQNYFINCLNH
jgi:hypothetical protein